MGFRVRVRPCAACPRRRRSACTRAVHLRTPPTARCSRGTSPSRCPGWRLDGRVGGGGGAGGIHTGKHIDRHTGSWSTRWPHTHLRHALRVRRRQLLARELPGAVGHRRGLRAGARVQTGRYTRATRLLAVRTAQNRSVLELAAAARAGVVAVRDPGRVDWQRVRLLLASSGECGRQQTG